MKIYVFKIFFYLLNNNYHEFSNYKFLKHQIKFIEQFENRFNEKKPSMLSYYLLPNGDENNKYEKELELFGSYDNSVKQFKDFIENHGIDIFYCVSSNLIVSNLALQSYVQKSNEYLKYTSFVKSLFDNQLKIPKITKKLFLLYSNNDEFNKIMKTKLLNDEGLTEINSITFEILLYSLRFCLQTTNCQNPKGLLYSQIITEDCEKKLSENCIPGNNVLDDIFVYNYSLVEKHLNTQPSNSGAYICSCGQYYDIGPYGFPIDKSKCLNCGKETGGRIERVPKGGKKK